jgi:moderate conductance mechanosensitive channel
LDSWKNLGTVIDICLKTTIILGWKGEVIILNSGDIIDITNFALHDSLAIFDFGIAYREDIPTVPRLLTAKLPKMRADFPKLMEDPQLLSVIN